MCVTNPGFLYECGRAMYSGEPDEIRKAATEAMDLLEYHVATGNP